MRVLIALAFVLALASASALDSFKEAKCTKSTDELMENMRVFMNKMVIAPSDDDQRVGMELIREVNACIALGHDELQEESDILNAALKWGYGFLLGVGIIGSD